MYIDQVCVKSSSKNNMFKYTLIKIYAFFLDILDSFSRWISV